MKDRGGKYLGRAGILKYFQAILINYICSYLVFDKHKIMILQKQNFFMTFILIVHIYRLFLRNDAKG